MDTFETEMVLSDLGINAPERCKSCPRVGSLIATLSTAQGNKEFLVTSTDEEVLTANARAQVAKRLRARYPLATDEQIASTVDNSVAAYLGSEAYTRTLEQAGELMEAEDATITTTLAELQTRIDACPPEGCAA